MQKTYIIRIQSLIRRIYDVILSKGMWAVPLAILIIFFSQYGSMKYLAGAILLSFLTVLFGKRAFTIPCRIPVIVLLALGFAITAVAVLQYIRMSDQADVDTAIYSNAFWNLAHGNIQPIFDPDSFSGHSIYLSVLFVPVFMLAGNVGLIIVQGILVALLAFLIVKELSTDIVTKTLYTIAVLATPGIVCIILFGFHPDCLAAPFILLALLAYKKEHLKTFLLWCFILLLTKEIFIFFLAGMVAVAFLEKRPVKWTALTLIVGIVFMAGYWYALNRFFAAGRNFYFALLPGSVYQWFLLLWRPESLLFIFLSILPYCLLTVPGYLRYLLLPLPVILFYAGLPDSGFRDFWRHYSFAAAAMASGILLFIPAQRLSRVAGCFLLSIMLMYPSWRPEQDIPLAEGRLPPLEKKVKTILPQDGTLLIHGPFLSHFASRKAMLNWVYSCDPIRRADLVLVDSLFMPPWLDKKKGTDVLLSTLRANPDWKMVFCENSLFLYRRDTTSP